jgi:membrane protein DedA with SNARE-associated domain
MPQRLTRPTVTLAGSSGKMRRVVDFITHHGLPLLFVVVMLESFGIPLPGETALIAFAILASQGNYGIEWVIFLAAAGAIVGDNLGYWLIGRVGGRALFARWGWLHRYSDRVLPRAERLMSRHGGKMVFFGRFITVLRYTAAWIAGLGKMPWWRFLFWNAAGGIAWATSVGLAAYYAGDAAKHAIERYGLLAALAIGLVLVLGWLAVHFGKRRLEERL